MSDPTTPSDKPDAQGVTDAQQPLLKALAERLKSSAEAIGNDFPGSHVICIAVQDGFVSLFAKSDFINDKLEVVAALNWIVTETVAQTFGEAKRALSKGTEAGG